MKKNMFLSTVASVAIMSTSALYADLDVAGTLNINTPGQAIPGTDRIIYSSILMTVDDDTAPPMAWVYGTGRDTVTGQSGTGIFNPDTGAAPFFILNDAISDMLAISQDSVIINNADILDQTLVGTANLIVGGDILASHDGPGTESVYRLLTLSANDTDGTGPSEAGFVLTNALYQKEWLFRTIDDGTAFTATLGGTGGAEFKVSSPTGSYLGTELFLGNGASNKGGVWINASSRALKENIKPLSTKEALTAFSKLQPVTYNYKTDKSEKVVGFIAEDVPALVAINSRDGLSSMDMVAVLTKVVQEQEKKMADKDAEMKEMKAEIAELKVMQKRLAKVESLLTNLALDTSNTKKQKVSFNVK